jgi:hypothetical protein
MFIDSPKSIKFFAPAERNISLDVLVYQYIALRWSAKQLLVAKSIDIWLRWSQKILELSFGLLSGWRLTERLPRSQSGKHIASAPHQHCSLEATYQSNEHGRHRSDNRHDAV